MSELKSCPWCNSSSLCFDEYQISCNNCEASGPVGDDASHTAFLWNTRHQKKIETIGDMLEASKENTVTMYQPVYDNGNDTYQTGVMMKQKLPGEVVPPIGFIKHQVELS